MLTLAKITKAYGERTLFADVSLQVNRGDRIGLVGPNGAGKSTLFSLILGETTPDDGKITFERNVALGFLPQETAPVADETVLELATAVSDEIASLRRLMKDHEARHLTDAEEYHHAQARFDELEGHALERKAMKILKGLAFRETDFQRPASALSGGWVMRAHLARLLVQQPDLLLLDEPTNHLDLESLVWFQEYLKGYPGSIVVVSHDREFLNQLVGSIVDIRQGRLSRYRGNYEEYLVQREAAEEQLLAAYKNQQREIQSLQLFADRFRAKASKASQAQSKLKQIERMEKIEAPVRDGRSIKFRFPQPPRSGLKVITLTDIHHAYGDTVVYRGMNYAAERGQRTVLVGPNGAGKSTLLKILAGAIPFQSGTREPGLNVKVGYYAQYRVEMLNPNHTVLEEVLDSKQPVPEQTARTVLGSFLFRGDDVFKRVSVLSGGEKSRLALVKLLLDPPNLLLMDEPTTHLDMPSIEALIGALAQYDGTLIFISHDVHFIRKLATTVLHINAGQLTFYPGDYQYYLDKSKAVSAREGLTQHGGPSSVPPAGSNGKVAQSVTVQKPRYKTKEQKRFEAEERQARSRARKEHEQRVAALEAEILRLETRQKELTVAIEDPASYSNGSAAKLNRELSDVTSSLEHLNEEWQQLTATETAIASG
jgi:ATP-binding cassette subfamily F protein 3